MSLYYQLMLHIFRGVLLGSYIFRTYFFLISGPLLLQNDQLFSGNTSCIVVHLVCYYGYFSFPFIIVCFSVISLLFNLFVSINLKHVLVSSIQFVLGILIQFDNVWLLIGMFCPFTFYINTILVWVCHYTIYVLFVPSIICYLYLNFLPFIFQ